MKKICKIVMIASLIIMNTRPAVYASTVNNSFSNLSDVEENIYEHLLNRDSQISFVYTGDKTEFKNNIDNIIRSSYEKDDYTERSWVEIKPKAEISGSEIDTNINVTYLTTKEEENYVDNELKNVVSQIITPTMNDIEKVKAINDYIISRFDYDYSHKSNDAYSALITGKTTCQGYTLTAYKMLKLAGIENRIIIGSLNGETHSWNYVKINDQWDDLDITSNDSTRSYKYFLVKNNVLEENKYIWDKSNYPQEIN